MTSPIRVEPTSCSVCGTAEAAPEAKGKDYLHETSDQDYTFCKCAGCGHIYLNPRPVIEEIGRIYPAQYATFTNRFGRADSLLARIKDRVLLSRFRTVEGLVPNPMRLLDVGCGDGGFLHAIRRKYPQAQLTGLDWHFGPNIAGALKSAGIATVTGTIETAPLTEEAYDVIIMNQIIEHVWDVRLTLNSCRAALKMGGLLAIETPNPDGWDRTFFRSGAWGSYYWPRHLNLFTKAHMTRILEESGLEVVSSNSLLAPPCWIYSIQFSASRAGVGPWFKSLFADNNILLLAVFAVLDRVALCLGAETSNQQMIARRVR
jgi:2-polyprenyl-3-methyl-5-hydroxy-6-metoxy-1,4-benzoquinol methylase